MFGKPIEGATSLPILPSRPLEQLFSAWDNVFSTDGDSMVVEKKSSSCLVSLVLERLSDRTSWSHPAAEPVPVVDNGHCLGYF